MLFEMNSAFQYYGPYFVPHLFAAKLNFFFTGWLVGQCPSEAKDVVQIPTKNISAHRPEIQLFQIHNPDYTLYFVFQVWALDRDSLVKIRAFCSALE